MVGTTIDIITTNILLNTALRAIPPPFNAYGRYSHITGPIDIANPAMNTRMQTSSSTSLSSYSNNPVKNIKIVIIAEPNKSKGLLPNF